MHEALQAMLPCNTPELGKSMLRCMCSTLGLKVVDRSVWVFIALLFRKYRIFKPAVGLCQSLYNLVIAVFATCDAIRTGTCRFH